MSSLLLQLNMVVGQVFADQGLPADLGRVRVSDRPDLCQFQCNGAMAAAKIAKKNPREIAAGVTEALAAHDIFTKVEIVGPGFINLNVRDAVLQEYLQAAVSDDRFLVPQVGQGQTVVLDYGGMNVAKAMHVGHLRSLAIGDCLKRMMCFAGYEALGDIHMGDWGLQMGQIISEFERRYPDWPYFDENHQGDYPAEPLFSYQDLEEIYPQASQACKDDQARLELARKATMELQEGRAGYLAIWQHFMDLSIADIRRNIAKLGVDFEIWKGEACVNDLIPEITQDLNDKGILVESDGAQIIPVAQDDDKQDIPPLLFLKSDGAALYTTTDVATIYDRIKTYPNLAKIIYETDLRQNLHFEQVFRAARKAGYVDDIELSHIGHGTVNGPDGKPFKTREGKAMRFEDMVAAVVEKAAQRLNEAELARDMSEEERADIAQKVAVSALKYNELSNQPHMDYIFDIDRMTKFEGKTGPYLLYQAVRIQSLLSKAGAQGYKTGAMQVDESDRALVLLLTEFPEQFESALTQLSPHILCDYVFKLAQTFSSFYGNCHILSEENADLRASRLALCDLTHRHIVFILGLLGISVPARM